MSYNYNLRFQDLIDSEKLLPVTIVGLGGIGSPLVKQLAQIGVVEFALYDFDTVEKYNCGTQNYVPADIGKYKVDVCVERIKTYSIAEHVVIDSNKKRATSDNLLMHPVTFFAVDSLEVRKELFGAMPFGADVWLIDGRMGSEMGEIFCLRGSDKERIEKYKRTFYPKNEQFTEPCTARATVYCGEFISSIMVKMYKDIVMGFPVPSKITFSLRNYVMEGEW